MSNKIKLEIICRLSTDLDPKRLGVSNEEEAKIVIRAGTVAAFRSIFGDDGDIIVNISPDDSEEELDETTINIKG